MTRLLKYLLVCSLLLTFVAGCTKNELTLAGTLSGGAGKNMLVLYRASDKEKDFMVENPVVLDSEGSFTLKVLTRYPTVMWIFATNSGELLMPVYGERGDELRLTGKYNEPWAWKVEGNDVMEEYCAWAAANINAVKSDNPAKLNAAVAAFVKEHPDSRTAAFILFTCFQTSGHEGEYKRLCGTLELDEDEMKQMRMACMAPDYIVEPATTLDEVLRLPDEKDSLVNINLKGRTTLLYMWRDNPDEPVRDLLRKALSDTTRQAIGIFLDSDTMRWHQSLRADTLLSRCTNLWAPGAEMNPALRKLRLSQIPCFLILNGKGEVTWRGMDAGEASAHLDH